MTTKKGAKKITVNLNDGELINLDTMIVTSSNENLINKESASKLNSAIIRSFETDSNNVNDLVDYVNYLSKDVNIGYWETKPSVIAFPHFAFPSGNEFDWKRADGFENYYHTFFKSKTARSFLFNQALDIVVSLCKSYPADFKKKILKELDELLLFSNSLKLIDPSYDANDFNDYWKGFLLRRYYTDNVPISEIQSSIVKAQTKIKLVDVSKQADAMYEININNHITLFYSSEKFSIYSKSSEKEISFGTEVSLKEIKYLKDNFGDYYQLIGFKNSEPIKYLYDKNLVKID